MAADKAIAIDMRGNGNNDIEFLLCFEDGSYEWIDRFNLADHIIRNSIKVYNLDIDYEDVPSTRRKAQSAQFRNKEITKRALSALQGNDTRLKVVTQFALISWAQQHKNEVKQQIINDNLRWDNVNKVEDLDSLYQHDIQDMFSIIDQNLPIAYTQVHLDTIVSDRFCFHMQRAIGWGPDSDVHKEKPKTYGFFPLH